MNIFDALELKKKNHVLNKLLPHGIDRTMAIVILYALNYDLSLIGVDLVEEGIYETGYYSVISRLPFNFNDINEEERNILEEYCLYFLK